jgi:SMC interacting uncharacterized protein involved in chromosome segregation
MTDRERAERVAFTLLGDIQHMVTTPVVGGYAHTKVVQAILAERADARREAEQELDEWKRTAELWRVQASKDHARLTEALERIERETQHGPLVSDGAIVQVRQALATPGKEGASS